MNPIAPIGPVNLAHSQPATLVSIATLKFPRNLSALFLYRPPGEGSRGGMGGCMGMGSADGSHIDHPLADISTAMDRCHNTYHTGWPIVPC